MKLVLLAGGRVVDLGAVWNVDTVGQLIALVVFIFIIGIFSAHER